MKKLMITGWLALSIPIIFSSVTFSQKVSSYESLWHSGLSAEDGEAFINKMQYEAKSKLLFLVSNDEKDLYVSLIITDRATIQKVMAYGLTTWFNPEGKHKKSLGIQFPLAPEEGAMPAFKREKGGEGKDMMKQMMAGKNRELALIGFSGKGKLDTVVLGPGSEFRGKMEMMDREKMLISLVVPIARIETAGVAGTDNLISMGFETGYMDLNKQGIAPAGGESGGGGGQHGGGGLYGGGGPPGGGAPSGGNADRPQQASVSELSRPTRLWINQVRLAVK